MAATTQPPFAMTGLSRLTAKSGAIVEVDGTMGNNDKGY